ncbi:MAG: hypothetical protein D6689_09445 [Deltaproteobacteria bacterium]|nr:MAG: hypothetical protein D6689_09445 [Deltaproteobacteria bacterium]
MTVQQLRAPFAVQVEPGSFEPPRHFYPRALNAQVHPLVSFFMRMSQERLVNRYCHLNPRVVPEYLTSVLRYRPRFFRWAGADLFHVTTEGGNRQMLVIETNSCPSGNKSMPILAEDQEQGGYRTLVERSLLPFVVKRAAVSTGGLAVVYDKNIMEASGYAAALADFVDEPVWLAPMPHDAEEPAAVFDDGLLRVRDAGGTWHPIRAALRYVTQRPWTRIPVYTKTAVFNPVIACLAGGRNKLVAAKAYDLYNAELVPCGLEICTPETIRDVSRDEIPLWIQRFGGHAVVKVPYANAGQGVFTITSEAELSAFMARDIGYERYIVQSLVGNHQWSSISRRGRLYQVGTMPNKRGEIYVADVRMMVCSTADGFRPLAVYARRARVPLVDKLASGSSWDVLGTNLSVRADDGGWRSDTDRLMLMDRRDFNLLGIGTDELIEGFIQTVLSVIAIDKLASALINQKGRLKKKLFRSLNDDDVLIDELMA